MAAGILGQASLSATTITDIYTVPVSKLATINISVCNRNSTPVTLRLALSTTTGLQATNEFIEYDVTIPGYGTLERSGILLQAGKIVTAYSNSASVSIVVLGFEEAA